MCVIRVVLCKKSPGFPSLEVAGPEFIPQALHFQLPFIILAVACGSTVERC